MSKDAFEALSGMSVVTGFTVLALARVRGVGPLLLLSRGLDRMRAAFACIGIAFIAGKEEYLRMYPACLAKAQRER